MLSKNGGLLMARFVESSPEWVKVLFQKLVTTEAPAHTLGRKISIVRTAESASIENLVASGELGDWKTRIAPLLKERESLILEGFPLDHVAEVCFRTNYRWRTQSSESKKLRLLITPEKKRVAA